jgi:prepilin-type N-terminal cleavage/methylation domain-containing protein/prepilin-type processing-associated H-X9-DG protein
VKWVEYVETVKYVWLDKINMTIPSIRSKRAFTLIELLVVIAIVAILAAILFPVFARARENARRSSCMSNMKQIGLGMMQYLQDYDERFPSQNSDGPQNYADLTIADSGSTKNWIRSIYPYVKSWQLFLCSSATPFDRAPPSTANEPNGDSNTNYRASGVIMQNPGVPVTILGRTSEIVVITEGPESYNTAFRRPIMNGSIDSRGLYTRFTQWNVTTLHTTHFEGGNLVFADGHVKWKKQSAICSADFGLYIGSATGTNVCGATDTALVGYASLN